MKSNGWLGLLLLFCLPVSSAGSDKPLHRFDLSGLNQRLAGQVLDYTNNHGVDRRIWSTALGQRRDLYVYLPPGFDPAQQYPALIWFHGFMQDEKYFVESLVEPLDRLMACGRLPPCIIAAPDGSLKGTPSLRYPGSFFVNSNGGNFEDFVIQDVWPFVLQNFPIRPEREAHALVGVSMGGFAAYNLGFKYRDQFKVVAGIYPPLNLRWVDCHGRYMGNFDPCCWGWRTSVDRGREVLARFYGGIITVRLKRVLDPLFGKGPEALAAVTRENPIEMIDALGIKEGDLSMWVGYGGRDEFNVDAQVESFLYRAKERGLSVAVDYIPKGRHNTKTASKLFPGLVNWIGPLLSPYSPVSRNEKISDHAEPLGELPPSKPGP